jgi:type IV secretion system protein VirB8
MSLKKVPADGLNRYLEESRGLERDYLGEILQSRKSWKTIGTVGVCFGGLSLAVLGIFIIVHSRPTPPVVVEVDKSTGLVHYLSTLDIANYAPGWAVDQQYLSTYVTDRESYDYNTIQDTYDTTGLMTDASIAKDFYSEYSGPNSRAKVLKNRSRVEVQINSIQQGDDSTATVRFSTIQVNDNGTINGPNNWIAEIAYKYSGAPMAVGDRWKDALGFEVTSYTVAPEADPATP